MMNRIFSRCPQRISLLCQYSTYNRNSTLNISKSNIALKSINPVRHSSHGIIPPLPALTLGASGLIPFFAPPLYMIYNNWIFCSDGEFMHLAYSASILSFLGGVRWGLTLPTGAKEIPNWRNLTYSVTPSLLAWTGVLLHCPLGYVPITVGLLGAGVIDVVWAGYPPWFKILRTILTVGALTSIGLLFHVKYKTDKSLGVTASIQGIKNKYYDWKNGNGPST
ncbi:hypothetical protein ACHWQZ_G015253 [Mnemiopsis leidyi]